MLKKEITYTDFDGNTVKEDVYFNLTRAEIVELQVSYPGEDGLMGIMQEAVKNEDKTEIIKYLKLLVGKAYGRRDGASFIKRQEWTEAFFASEAYSELFMSFFTNPQASVDFVNGVMPAGLVKEAEERSKTIEKVDLSSAEVKVTPNLDFTTLERKSDGSLTRAELLAMPKEDLQVLMKKLGIG